MYACRRQSMHVCIYECVFICVTRHTCLDVGVDDFRYSCDLCIIVEPILRVPWQLGPDSMTRVVYLDAVRKTQVHLAMLQFWLETNLATRERRWLWCVKPCFKNLQVNNCALRICQLFDDAARPSSAKQRVMIKSLLSIGKNQRPCISQAHHVQTHIQGQA